MSILHNQGVVGFTKILGASDLQSNYPIGLSLDKFLDLFADVKSIQGNGVAIVQSTFAPAFNITDILGGLQALDQVGDGSNSSFFGESHRKILPVGLLTNAGAELSNSASPTVLTDYPVHRIGNNSGYVEIDFGQTKTYAGLFYPKITILFGNGMGNTVGGQIVGSIDFTGYGSIPIYSGANDTILNFCFAAGSIAVDERYSSLRSNAIQAAVGDSLTFTAQDSLSYLSSYQTAFVGGIEVSVAAAQNTLTLVVPKYAKSGPVRFLSTGPQFDSFLSYDEIKIA